MTNKIYATVEDQIIANTVLAIDSFYNDTPCWLWMGARNSSGYGYVSVWHSEKGSRKRLAHRVSYEAFKGPIPEGEVVKHLCNVKLCASPLHIEAGTQSDNMKQCVAEGRHNNFGRPREEQPPAWHQEY